MTGPDLPPPPHDPPTHHEATHHAADRRGISPVRHLTSLVVALGAVPIGYLALDVAIFKGLLRSAQTFESGLPPFVAVLALAVMVAAFGIASACGRLSGLGPLVAAVVWGGVPALWALVNTRSLFRFVDSLPDVSTMQTGFGVVSFGVVLFSLVAAMLLGSAVSGRWRV